MKRESSTSGTRSTETEKTTVEMLKAALKKTKADPSAMENWDALEEIAGALQKPDEVMGLYQKVLVPGFPVDKVTPLLERALRFHDEWFAGDTKEAVEVLDRANSLDPGSDVALDRLTILLSVTQDFEPLLVAYDRTLAAIADGPRKRRLLQDAATVARDSGALDRASAYLRAIVAADPTANDVALELERLLERQGDFTGLVALQKQRLSRLSGAEAQQVREQLAAWYIEKLGRADEGLAEIEVLVSLPNLIDDTVPCALAERILVDAAQPAGTRRRALAILRARHAQMKRIDKLVAALQAAGAFASPDERVSLVHEAADVLERKGDLAAAREQIVLLLAIEPAQAATRARLKFLAEVTHTPEAYVRGLLAAAEATADEPLRVALWLEAASMDEQRSKGGEVAVALYQKVVANPAARPEQVLSALRRLSSLLLAESQIGERLAVVERQAELEPGAGVRRGLLGEAAEIAASLGQLDRALGLWAKRLALDPNDRKALARTIELLEETNRFTDLLAALDRRAKSNLSWILRRSDLLRMALLLRDRLGDAEGALAVLGRILGETPEDREALHTTLDLYSTVGRHQDFLALGSALGERDRKALSALLVRLGDVCRGRLGDRPGAARYYAEALAADPQSTAVREGLWAMAQDPESRGPAVDGLLRAFEGTGDWQGLLALLPIRLELAQSQAARAQLLAEAARLEEEKAGRPAAAFAHVRALFPLCPEDGRVEGELLRLAEVTQGYREAVTSVEAALAAVPDGSPRILALGLLVAQLHEQKLGDKAAALAGFERLLAQAPQDRRYRAEVVRLAGELGQWPTAVSAAFVAPALPEEILGIFLPRLEALAADQPKAFESLGNEIARNLASLTDGLISFVRTVETRIADYPVEAPLRPAWRRKALARAVAADPTHLPTLQKLAAVQKSEGGQTYFDTLMQMAALAPNHLDPLAEAVSAAQGLTAKHARHALELLYQASSRLVRQGQKNEGQVAAAEALLKSATALAQSLAETHDRADAKKAVEILLETSRLNIPKEAALGLRDHAGRLALDVDKTLAREILRQVLEEAPKNREALQSLGRIYTELDQVSELLALKKRELDEVQDMDERLALRLEIARLGEIVETRVERFEILLGNLAESPGHEPTLKILGQFLRTRGRFLEWVDIVAAQARILEGKGETTLAAQLWREVAVIFETHLSDLGRAIAAYEKVVTLASDALAMEAIARLYEAMGEPLQAAHWLEQRLALGDPTEKQQAVIHLATLYLTGGQGHRAILTLERALSEDPKVDALWVLLAKLHREAGHGEALLRVLTQRAMHLEDAVPLRATAEEVLALCRDTLHDPVAAIPVLERACLQIPKDPSLRLALADGLTTTGRLADAREVLETLLATYGRRQSRERAAVHLRIAQVARQERDLALAAKHLEQASQVMLDSMDVQLALAEVAEERGEIDRAEKAYRALLVLTRRGHGDGQAITAGEVHLRLRRINLKQKQGPQAKENLESALSRALHDPMEAQRIQAALLADGEFEILLGLIAKRRTQATQPADEATLSCEEARALEAMGKTEEALGMVLGVLGKVPDHTASHDLCRQIAKRLGQSTRYLEAIVCAMEKLRRSDDAAVLVRLLLRAARVAEEEVQDPARALGYLQRAEQSDPGNTEVLSHMARLAALLGDGVKSRKAADRLRKMTQESVDPGQKADAGYRLAEALLNQESTRDEGLAALSLAVENSPDLTRAMALVQSANVPDSALVRVLPVYEKVARASKNERLLLDFFERRAAIPDASVSDIREGVELAVSLGDSERAEKLMAQAIAVGQKTGLRDVLWAILDLTRRYRMRGAVAQAAEVLETAREEWLSPRLLPLVRETAKAASASPETEAVATRLYQELFGLFPTDREIWEPLLTLYARKGNRAGLESLARELSEKLMSRMDRSAVRMAWARFLMAQGETTETLISTLRDVLMEEPGQLDALTLLSEIYEKRGEVSEAVTLLSDALASSDGILTGSARATLARRLGDLLKKADPAQAKEVYRAALATSLPDVTVKRSLQFALIELLTEESDRPERADLWEELLRGETGEEATRRAVALCELRLALGDETGAKRALELGHKQAPEQADLTDRLGRFYTERGLWTDAVSLFTEIAQAEPTPEHAAELYREVARWQREKLSDPKASAQTLRRAMPGDPTNIDLVGELCDALVAAGEYPQAMQAVSEALERAEERAPRIGLLRLRAKLAVEGNNDDSAAQDLEEVLALGEESHPMEFATVLSRIAGRASVLGETEKARAATLRLADVLRNSGDGAKADQVLIQWIEIHPSDREVIYQLRDRFMRGEQWELAAHMWERLVHAEEGEAKATSVLALADVYLRLERPAEAIPWLQGVVELLPNHRELKQRLAGLYESTGNPLEGARLRYTLVEHEPDENERYTLLVQIGQSLLAAGQGAEAAAALERAVELPLADRTTRVLLLDSYIQAKIFDRASGLLDGLLANAKTIRSDELALLYQRQARLYAAAGDRNEYLTVLKKALDTDRKNVTIANELADIAETLGDDELAMRALRVVAAGAGKDRRAIALAYLRQARIAQRAHDRSRAIIFVKRALQEDPSLTEAKEFLDQLR